MAPDSIRILILILVFGKLAYILNNLTITWVFLTGILGFLKVIFEEKSYGNELP